MDAVLRNVERCRAHPDFATFDGASEASIAAAERALGTTLPAPHRALLAATNGLGVRRGWLNWFGVGDDAVVDIAAFNRPDGWLAELPDDWLEGEGVTWVGVRYDHTLLGLRGDQALFVNLLERRSRAIVAHVELPLTRGLARGLSRGIRRGRDRHWRRIVRQVGGLALDEGLVLGPRHYADGIVDTSLVTTVSLTDALVLAAELAADDDGGSARRLVTAWRREWTRRRFVTWPALLERAR